MSQRITLLGTGTCQLEPERKASSVLVELDGLRLVFDLGRGIADRLAEVGLRQDDVEHIVLSHFHPDHLSDLVPYLHGAAWSRTDPRHRDLHLYGPLGLEVQLMRLLGLFGPETLQREHFRLHLHEERGEDLAVAGRRLRYPDLPPAGNHGLGFTAGSTRVALTGDSSFHEQEIAFLAEADLAVIDSGHLEDEEIVELAVRAGTRHIVCSHLYRPIDGPELTRRARAEGYGGTISEGRDLQVFDLA